MKEKRRFEALDYSQATDESLLPTVSNLTNRAEIFSSSLMFFRVFSLEIHSEANCAICLQ